MTTYAILWGRHTTKAQSLVHCYW